MTTITKDMIKTAQEGLNKYFGFSLTTDGIMGPKTKEAFNFVTLIATEWETNRKVIAMIQVYAMMEGLDTGPIDGKFGPQTQTAFNVLTKKDPAVWRTDEGEDAYGSTGKWPIQTQTELEKFYGPVGSNQTTITVPYPLRVAWDTNQVIKKFQCHEKVADSIVKVLTRAADHYGWDKMSSLRLDLWGGCLNVRKLRGGTGWSTHAWGIAVDWDPENNQLRWDATKASLAKKTYDKWWNLWEEEGWTSLGRSRDYDWMHVQAADIKK